MIYTVTLNPALDYVLTLDELQSKDINRTKDEQLFCGGKGINVSAILTELGADNEALGFVAGFSGIKLEEMLTKQNIKNRFIHLSDGYTRINVKIKAQNEFDINTRGAKITDENIEELAQILDERLNKGDYLVLAGSVPDSLSSDVYEKLLCRYSDREVSFVVDTTGELLLNVLSYKPFLIKPNHFELGELFGVEVSTTDDIISYCKKLQDMGARNVLVSRGKDGAVLLDENGEVHAMGNVPGKINNSVGCGDSMVAGFVAGYIEKGDYAYALKLGCVCGNATAFSDFLATKAEIDEMMNNEYLN